MPPQKSRQSFLPSLIVPALSVTSESQVKALSTLTSLASPFMPSPQYLYRNGLRQWLVRLCRWFTLLHCWLWCSISNPPIFVRLLNVDITSPPHDVYISGESLPVRPYHNPTSMLELASRPPCHTAAPQLNVLFVHPVLIDQTALYNHVHVPIMLAPIMNFIGVALSTSWIWGGTSQIQTGPHFTWGQTGSRETIFFSLISYSTAFLCSTAPAPPPPPRCFYIFLNHTKSRHPNFYHYSKSGHYNLYFPSTNPSSSSPDSSQRTS